MPIPLGPRVANAAGIPRQAYRHDQLSDVYHRRRAENAAAGRSRTQAKRARAQQIARAIIAEHGPRLVVEHTNIRAWAAMWGRGIALFSPGMLIAALKLECAATGGQLLRARTWQTALSQQCPCGARANKPLCQRVHRCTACGLVGDRDQVAAAMAACVELTDPHQPATARINEDFRAAFAARVARAGLQEALARSTATTGTPPPAPAGTAAPRQRAASAERTRVVTTGPTATPDETPHQRRPRGTAKARRLHTEHGEQSRLNS
ncbi:zinc ribbon domain-containing protein [Actinoplanes sp. CA-131856]